RRRGVGIMADRKICLVCRRAPGRENPLFSCCRRCSFEPAGAAGASTLPLSVSAQTLVNRICTAPLSAPTAGNNEPRPKQVTAPSKRAMFIAKPLVGEPLSRQHSLHITAPDFSCNELLVFATFSSSFSFVQSDIRCQFILDSPLAKMT